MSLFKLHIEDQEIALDRSDIQSLDSVSPNTNSQHILHGNKAYVVEGVEVDVLTKQVQLSVNGTPYTVQVSDEYDQLVSEMGLSLEDTSKAKNVDAPMPGLVVDVLVSAGQDVEKGTPLLILEAMKMENVLKADGAGTVKSVVVSKGDAVSKSQVMIEME